MYREGQNKKGDEEKKFRFEEIKEKNKLRKERWVKTKKIKIRGKLGQKERKEWEKFLQLDETERELRIETSEAKENLWRWRDKKKLKGKEKMRKKFTIQKVELMERRLEKLNSIIEECKREREDWKKKLEEEKIKKRTRETERKEI